MWGKCINIRGGMERGKRASGRLIWSWTPVKGSSDEKTDEAAGTAADSEGESEGMERTTCRGATRPSLALENAKDQIFSNICCF